MMVRPSHRRIHLNRLSQEPGPAQFAPNQPLYNPVSELGRPPGNILKLPMIEALRAAHYIEELPDSSAKTVHTSSSVIRGAVSSHTRWLSN